MACPKMCLNIFFEIIYSLLDWGLRSRSVSDGGSVAKAREAKVSMIKLIHNIWIGFNTSCFRTPAPIKVITTATTLTVSWNWMNFLIESYIFLPHTQAETIDLKLSSRSIIEAAYLATSVPAIPIANPTSAYFKAGASFVPSPVTATTWPHSLSPVTSAYLCSGWDLAMTAIYLYISLNLFISLRVSSLIYTSLGLASEY